MIRKDNHILRELYEAFFIKKFQLALNKKHN